MTQYTRRRHHRVRRRFLAAFATAGLLVGGVMLPGVNATQAAWTDSEHTGGTFTARVEPMPVENITVEACSSPLFGGDTAYQVVLTFPNNSPPGTTAIWTPPSGVATNVTPVHLGNGRYRITYTRDQLGWRWLTPINLQFTLHMQVNGVNSSPRTLPVVRSGISGDPNCDAIT